MVVDASVPAALLFGELANVCLIKFRRYLLYRQALRPSFRLRKRLAIGETAVDHDGAVELAAATGLTACDASYLWLARSLDAELVTLDQQLARAVAR